ncbi:SLC13 family permease [Arthrobacter sp. H35-D1]|uniref:SLC13 family permease n=1 Tax=Arthrobacter sp. H35-D1 TaxID=3046202 RepID=UPI0024B8DEED|nr:SLC13 family permease [Arthrobacter sp. H35-D1]MDJ0312840.1 ArsB/NhaD family transporter [Arthrobacter sp. H35-D1]
MTTAPAAAKALAASVPAALFAAGLALLASGLLTPASALELASRTVPILVFVVAMTVVTGLADSAGLFTAVTARLAGARRSADPGPTPSGRVWLLWLLAVALATVSTVSLSLDTTAVLVTPVVVSLARHARIPPLPFALTTVWLANTASLLLPVSNLTNLLAQHRLGLSPWGFAQLLWAPAAVGVAVPVVFLLLIFRTELHGSFPRPAVPHVKDRGLLAFSAVTVAVLLPLLVSGLPVWIPTSVAAVFLLAVFVLRRQSSPGWAAAWRMLPVQPLLLAMGLFLIIQTLHDHGLGTALARASGTGESFTALLQLAGLGALSANAVNNLPAYLALEPAAGSPLRLAALLIGVNLGPLVSPWASLATLLWHSRLRAMGINISWRGYMLAGAAVVVVLLPLSVLALWLSAGMPG